MASTTIHMKTMKLQNKHSQVLKTTYAIVFSAMAFGLGALINNRLRNPSWNKYTVALQVILVFCGGIYGMAWLTYSWWRLRVD